MSIIQFARILWARRLLIFAATISCFVGAIVVCKILPPRWEAHSRVILGVLKPDPITGTVPPSNSARGYIATQTELITDYSVAGQVADQLGWFTDPGLIRAYQSRSRKDGRDFRHWLAQIVIDRTKAKVLQDSNILEITYTATNPSDAKAVADALMNAYIQQSLLFHRQDATNNADWNEKQAANDKKLLDAATAAESAFERDNGIVMEDGTTDVDTARLKALSMQGAAAPMIAQQPGTSQAQIELAQIDAQIDQAAKTLGPNHPDLLALRARRTAIAALVAKEGQQAKAFASGAASGVGALDRAVQQQKSRVLGESDKLSKLSQLQAEVDLRRDQYNKSEARAAELRQEAAVDDTGLTPLGSAATPKAPAFPNYLLIVPGSLGLGLAFGVLLALLLELLARKIRGIEDLRYAIDAPILAVIDGPERGRRSANPAARGPGIFRRRGLAKA